MFTWRFYSSQNPESFSEELLQKISDVFADGFGIIQGWGIKGVKKAILRSSIFGVLVEEHTIGGYAFYSIPDAKLNGGYMLWEDAICIKKQLHGSGFASRILFEKVCGYFKGRRFDWIGGRTQNPLVILRYSKLGSLFPFDHLYSEEEGALIMKFLLKNIAEVQEAENLLNRKTGICRAIYPEGKLGDFEYQGVDVEKYEELLGEWNFQRENGDAVIIVAKLDRPILIS